MRKLLLFALCSLLVGNSLSSQSEIQINSGATLKMSGAVYMNVNEMSIQNDGDISAGVGSKVTLLSSNTPSDVVIRGTTESAFDQLEFNVSDEISLEQNIQVRSALVATNGMLDLNEKVLTLVDGATISGESADDGITGTSGGTVQMSTDLNAPSNYSPGNMGIAITSASNLGPTVVERGHLAPTSMSGGYGIDRYYEISPTNNSGLNATLRFNYRDDELGDLLEGELELFRSTDGGATWTYEGYTTRDETNNWIELSGIDGFSQWTLGSRSSSSLPVELAYFRGECRMEGIELSWLTTTELNNDYFAVEYSLDGRDWQLISQIDGAGTTTTSQYYSYLDRRFAGEENLYRLRQVDLDGTTTFSEVVHIDCGSFSDAPIVVFPNPATDKVVISLRELSSQISFIRLSDETGEIIRELVTEPSQEFEQYEISMERLPAGIYFIQVQTQGKPYNFRLVKIEE